MTILRSETVRVPFPALVARAQIIVLARPQAPDPTRPLRADLCRFEVVDVVRGDLIEGQEVVLSDPEQAHRAGVEQMLADGMQVHACATQYVLAEETAELAVPGSPSDPVFLFLTTGVPPAPSLEHVYGALTLPADARARIEAEMHHPTALDDPAPPTTAERRAAPTPAPSPAPASSPPSRRWKKPEPWLPVTLLELAQRSELIVVAGWADPRQVPLPTTEPEAATQLLDRYTVVECLHGRARTGEVLAVASSNNARRRAAAGYAARGIIRVHYAPNELRVVGHEVPAYDPVFRTAPTILFLTRPSPQADHWAHALHHLHLPVEAREPLDHLLRHPRPLIWLRGWLARVWRIFRTGPRALPARWQ